ncbi:hypothetical protein [Streptomyces sp. BPTC-684]|uniref:hypothetical protein n=1 Tax=Streptomyces sp. BPTC-684 TaxID=3043734 RepID=UPI0024B0560B|nr:hypothetical protein [Streptomyces sp. BPTC-684]WHM40304.1 hypothetical protein QIY60_27915 [Streptomyces sp. BPTC-684]
MTDQSQTRRGVIRAAGGAALAAGAMALGAPAAQAAPHHGTKSTPAVPPGAAAHNEARAAMGLPIPDEVTAYQNNWRFCNYCFGLWWNGNPTNGACPSRNSPDGQHHGPGSWNFILPANPAEHI